MLPMILLYDYSKECAEPGNLQEARFVLPNLSILSILIQHLHQAYLRGPGPGVAVVVVAGGNGGA